MGAIGVGWDMVKEMCKEDWGREGRFWGVRVTGGAYVKGGMKPWGEGGDIVGKCAKMGIRGRKQVFLCLLGGP